MQDGLLYCAYHNNHNHNDNQGQNEPQQQQQLQLPPCPAALLNNLGLLELDERHATRHTTQDPLLTHPLTNTPLKNQALRYHLPFLHHPGITL